MPTGRYHHGDLRNALLHAAEEELTEKGVAGFSLRGCAKRAGVSHAAPAHTFGNAEGLLAALVEEGFVRLDRAMRRRMDGARDPSDRLVASGLGYMAFARENRALFELMFGGRVSLADRMDAQSAAGRAFETLCEAVATARGRAGIETSDDWQAVATAWSLVHGQAHLENGGHLTMLGEGEAREAALCAMLETTFAAAQTKTASPQGEAVRVFEADGTRAGPKLKA